MTDEPLPPTPPVIPDPEPAPTKRRGGRPAAWHEPVETLSTKVPAWIIIATRERARAAGKKLCHWVADALQEALERG